jgi:hypothetical protein
MITTPGQIVLLVGGAVDALKDQGLSDEHDFDVVSTDELDIRIEEAALALSGAVFSRGWRLGFRHNPIFTPLALEVVIDYWQPLPGEESGSERGRATPLLIFGNTFDVDDREQTEQALHIGCASLLPEEELNYETLSRVVCVGGTREVEKQIGLISEKIPQVPIFTIPSTGGAAQAIVDRPGITNAEPNIVREIVARRLEARFEPPHSDEVSDSDKRLFAKSLEHERIPRFRYAIYPILMDMILESDERGGTMPSRRP